MATWITQLLDRLTPQEQAKLETFAAFLIARRRLENSPMLTDDLSAVELLELTRQSGSFDWLADPREEVYTLTDGEAVAWVSGA